VERIGGKKRVGDLVCELTAIKPMAESISSKRSCSPRGPPSPLLTRNLK
jgi:hypothetical protein